MDVYEILSKRLSGDRITAEEALFLYENADIISLGETAYDIKRSYFGDSVFWRKDVNINHTNICVSHCGFCSFRKDRGDYGAYEYTVDQILDKVSNTLKYGVNEIHIVGGLNPNCNLEYFEKVFRGIKGISKDLCIEALTAVEVNFLSKLAKLNIHDTLKILKESGLDIMPGGGSEIFNPYIRKKMMATKITAKEWLSVHRNAHLLGIETNATMLFGHVEKPKDIIEHMDIIRKMQDETKGIVAFVPLAYNKDNNILAKRYNLSGPSGVEDLRVIAISRIFFDNIKHIKIPWVTVGKNVAQISISFGADDIGGTAYEERILDAAGGNTWEEVKEKDELVDLIKEGNGIPVLTTSEYTGV
jgi:aminodeoxyfutalosine synthase